MRLFNQELAEQPYWSFSRSRSERTIEISRCVNSSVFLTASSVAEDAKATFLPNGLWGERTNTTGHPSFSQKYLDLLSLSNGLPHCGQFTIFITQHA
jgi:hypothetical protein